MNDLIQYNNLLYDQGLDSPAAAAILDAHANDNDFTRRARFARFACEARKRREAWAKARRKTAYFLVGIGSLLIGVGALIYALS